jgi:DNA-binding MarR family transcriptional regulator
MLKNKSDFDLQQFFPYQLSLLAGRSSEYIAKIHRQEYDLSKFEWRIVATIGQHAQMSAKDICQFTGLEKMQTSRAIKKLVSRGLLHQQTCDRDRRAVLIQLSAKGLQMYTEIMPLVKQQEQRMLAGLSGYERKQLMLLTQKLSSQLEN